MSQRQRQEKAASEQRRKWRRVGFLTAGLFGAMLVLFVVGVLLALHTPPPPIVHTNPEAARRLERELKEAESTASTGKAKVVQADETALNSLLAKEFDPGTSVAASQIASVVKDMKLTLADDRMHLYVLAIVREREVALQLEGRLSAKNGYMDFEPTNGKIGSLPLPKSFLKNAVEKVLSTPEGLEAMRLPSNVRDLHVEDGKLVVVFK